MEYDEQGNIIDPISLDLIPENRAILITQKNVTFCFDIDTLAQYVCISGYNNPMNREPFDKDTINQIDTYILERTRYIPVCRDGFICAYITIYKWNKISDLVTKIQSLQKYNMYKVYIREQDVDNIDRDAPIEERKILIQITETDDNEGCIVI